MSDKTGIVTISMMDNRPHKAIAMYDHSASMLFIHSCIPINRKNQQAAAWVPELKEEMRGYIQKGFTVLVEDITGSMLIDGATPFSFDELYEGRPMLFHALDYNFSMQSLRQLTYFDGVGGYIIQSGGEGSKIDTMQDDKGRKIYKVEWNSFNGGHKAVLMCICAAMMPPLTASYLETMYGLLDEKENEGDTEYLSTWNKITIGQSLKKYREHEAQFNEKN